MPLVEVEPGIQVHVQDVGAGRPVVLLAGFGFDHEPWDRQIRVLSATNRVIAIDVRGTGYSSKPASGYQMDRIVADVEQVLEHLDLRAVTIVGWSFGGQIGMRLAATSPGRLAQLVLVCSHGVRASRSNDFPFGPPTEKLEASQVRGEASARLASRRRNIHSGFYHEPDPDLIDWLVRCQLRMPSWAAIACYQTYAQTHLVADLPKISLPVLQIIGAQDPVTPPEAAPWLQERLVDSRLVPLAECGHFPMFEAADEFDGALLGFIEEIP